MSSLEDLWKVYSFIGEDFPGSQAFIKVYDEYVARFYSSETGAVTPETFREYWTDLTESEKARLFSEGFGSARAGEGNNLSKAKVVAITRYVSPEELDRGQVYFYKITKELVKEFRELVGSKRDVTGLTVKTEDGPGGSQYLTVSAEPIQKT